MDILSLLGATDTLFASKIQGGEDIAPPVVVKVESVVSKAEAKRIANGPTPERAKHAPAVLPPVEFVPCYTTATIFLLSIKRAGFRPVIDTATSEIRLGNNGAPILLRDAGKVRDDEVNAIAIFMGYDRKTIHGVQLEAARRRAMILVKPYLGGDGKVKRTAPSVAGYVAGSGAAHAPDRLLADLNAKLRVCVDLKCKTADKADLAVIDAMIDGLHKQIETYR
jgi:hypothetical protein